MRYFLLDKVTAIELEKSVRGIKCISLSEQILHDHFPDHPIFPGALIIEGMAQLTGFLLEVSFNKDQENIKRAILIQVDKMKFYHTSGPGDTLEYSVEIASRLEDAIRVQVEAQADGKTRVKGKLTFQLMDVSSENVTKQRLNIYKIWTRGLENCPTLI